MSEKLFNNLVKLGNKNPELRDDISPVLHHLSGKVHEKVASSFDIRSEYMSTVDRHLEEIWQAKFDLLDKAEQALDRENISLDQRLSRMDYYMHGSDGLIVGGKLHLTDQAQMPRSREEIDEIVQDTVEAGVYRSSDHPNEPREWIAKFGNWSRVKNFN